MKSIGSRHRHLEQSPVAGPGDLPSDPFTHLHKRSGVSKRQPSTQAQPLRSRGDDIPSSHSTKGRDRLGASPTSSEGVRQERGFRDGLSALTTSVGRTLGYRSPGTAAEPPRSRDSSKSTKSGVLHEMRTYFSQRPPCLSDFELKKTVGTGTFGRVRVVRLNRSAPANFQDIPLALKILKKSKIIQMKQVEHVKSEKNILQSISHPFIVNLCASFQDDKRLYMLMEYVNGGELFSHLRREVRLGNDHARFYAAEIVLAFEYLHNLRIVYRDLKPENLLLDTQGHIKMTDFGFAKIVDDRTWTLCGTPEYLAPEIIQSKGHGKSVDWWALGILIYEMLVGAPPFYDENPMNIYKKVMEGVIDYPDFLESKAKDLIRKLLTHDRTKRYGCLKYGADDVKRHRFFRGIEWYECFHRQLRAPYLPQVKGPEDTSMFDSYPETGDNDATVLSATDQEYFLGF